MKKIFFCLILVSCFSFLVSPSLAVKKRVFGKAVAVSTSKSVIVTPRLRADRGALLINFSGLSLAKSVTYELTYLGSGQEQGVFGSVDPTTAGSSTSRSLYFGTCSHNVCNPHTGVKDARLTVVVKTTAGKTITKRYRIKT